MWLAACFNLNLITFLTNTFDQVYESAICSSISEILAFAFAGVLFQLVGARASLFISFAIAIAGGSALLGFGLTNPQSMAFPIIILVAKFGIACAFNIVYVAHS